ncbi:hypothetical protein C8J57DRAFT_1538041 [Mycena rebaudengoi]|nr:hypothetical protein C8J57DRAFT_1538041 [Mycena rebaudengoi]
MLDQTPAAYPLVAGDGPVQLSATEVWSNSRAECKDIYTCPICIGNLHKPVMPLCMHIFCYACIHQTLCDNTRCPICHAPIQIPPIRDDAFELDLFDAIREGLVKAPDVDEANLPARWYDWDGVRFASNNT